MLLLWTIYLILSIIQWYHHLFEGKSTWSCNRPISVIVESSRARHIAEGTFVNGVLPINVGGRGLAMRSLSDFTNNNGHALRYLILLFRGIKNTPRPYKLERTKNILLIYLFHYIFFFPTTSLFILISLSSSIPYIYTTIAILYIYIYIYIKSLFRINLIFNYRKLLQIKCAHRYRYKRRI